MASRYWVATTTTNFNDTAGWSATSNGSSGASFPVAGDDVVFDAGGAGGSKTGNCTLNVALATSPGYASWTVTTDYTGSITNSSNRTFIISGNLSIANGTWAFGTSIGHSVGGNVTLSGGTIGAALTGNPAISVTGNWNASGISIGSSTITLTNLTITMLGTAKTFLARYSSSQAYKTVVFSGTTTIASSATRFCGLICTTLQVAAGCTLTNSYTTDTPNTGNGGVSATQYLIDGTSTYAGTGSQIAQTANIDIDGLGSWTNTGSTYVYYTSTLNLGSAYVSGTGAAGSPTLAGTWIFNHKDTSTRTLTLKGEGALFTGAVTFDQDQASGTYTVVNQFTSSLESQGNFTVSQSGGGSITWTKGTSDLKFSGGSATISLVNKTYENITVAASGTKTIGSTFTTGVFNATAGTLALASAVISASSFTLADGVVVSTLAGATINTTGNLTCSGHSGSNITLNPNSTWTANVTGTGTFNYAAVKNCNATGTQITATNNCTDSGSNTNVLFTVSTGYVETRTSTRAVGNKTHAFTTSPNYESTKFCKQI